MIIDPKDFIDELYEYLLFTPVRYGLDDDDLPETVPGSKAIEAMLAIWAEERTNSGGWMTYNDLECIFRSIFWFANSNAFHLAQASIPNHDEFLPIIIVKENYTELEKFINHIKNLAPHEQAFLDSWWFFRFYIERKNTSDEDFDEVLIAIMHEALKIVYRIFYVGALRTVK